MGTHKEKQPGFNKEKAKPTPAPKQAEPFDKKKAEPPRGRESEENKQNPKEKEYEPKSNRRGEWQ
jgi:hypothetical protein